MDSTTAKEVDRQLFKYLNERDMDAVDHWIDEYIAEDFINHSPHFGEATDKNGFKELFKKFAEFGMTIEQHEMVFEDDVLCFRNTVHIEGKPVSTGIAMGKFRGGKMIERWAITQAL